MTKYLASQIISKQLHHCCLPQQCIKTLTNQLNCHKYREMCKNVILHDCEKRTTVSNVSFIAWMGSLTYGCWQNDYFLIPSIVFSCYFVYSENIIKDSGIAIKMLDEWKDEEYFNP